MTASATVVADRSTDVGWVRAWPLRKPAMVGLGIGAALLFAATTLVGLLYLGLLDDGPVGRADRRAVEWLAERRTSTWNTLSYGGSMLSDTAVKVVAVAVVGGAMVWFWRRLHDGVFLAVSVILEAAVFLCSSLVVGRDRPPVETLDPPAPSGSLPSGHTAAAVAFYGAVFVIICWHTKRTGVRIIFGVVAVAAPLAVGVSRVQRGMHHPVDVAVGIVLGVATLLVVRAAIARGVVEIDRHWGERAPAQVRRLDLTKGESP